MKLTTPLAAMAVSLFALTPGVASAAPILGAFSISGFGGSFVGGAQTAQTATGLDVGAALGSGGNGYGIAGTALIGNATGSFLSLNGATASVADIALGLFANPFSSTSFISFGSASNILVSFANAALTRSTTGTSITIAGPATFTDGVSADATTGIFSLSANSQSGSPTNSNFTFTGNASAMAAAVPEPAAWAMMILGMGAVGFAIRRQKIATAVSYAA